MSDTTPALLATRDSLVRWFHQELGTGCVHESRGVRSCEAWADQMLCTGPLQTPAEWAAGLADDERLVSASAAQLVWSPVTAARILRALTAVLAEQGEQA